MGSRESKVKSSSRTPPSQDHGSRVGPVTGGHSMPMHPVRSTSPAPIPVWPDSSVRWQSQYDVYICHSEDDCSYAMEMLSFLEQQPEKLRCFLPLRDMVAGGPIPSEMCSGLESSHCWVMLLTPQFLSDSWCKYQMHQFLAQAPCSNGRLIPVIIGLSFAQYPSVVKHMYAIKGAFNDPSVFSKVKEAIVTYLKGMITVTSDQIPAHSSRSRTPESSPSTTDPVGNSLGETLVKQEPTSDRAIRSAGTQEPTSDVSMIGPMTGQETTSDVSMIGPMTGQETTSDLSLIDSMTRQETTSDLSMIGSMTGQETTSDLSVIGSMTGQETTSDQSVIGSMTGQEPPCWLQDPHSDISVSLISRIITADCELFTAATKDSSPRETQDTSDSGVWSMTRDLLTDCSDYDAS